VGHVRVSIQKLIAASLQAPGKVSDPRLDAHSLRSRGDELGSATRFAEGGDDRRRLARRPGCVDEPATDRLDSETVGKPHQSVEHRILEQLTIGVFRRPAQSEVQKIVKLIGEPEADNITFELRHRRHVEETLARFENVPRTPRITLDEGGHVGADLGRETTSVPRSNGARSSSEVAL
jgi:hypothetical protein